VVTVHSAAQSAISPTTTSPAAGQAGDDDVEETSDGSDDCLQHGGNAVDDCHQAVTDSAEDAFNLFEVLSATGFLNAGSGKKDLRMIRRHPL
jgi:hypothetical protein